MTTPTPQPTAAESSTELPAARDLDRLLRPLQTRQPQNTAHQQGLSASRAANPPPTTTTRPSRTSPQYEGTESARELLSNTRNSSIRSSLATRRPRVESSLPCELDPANLLRRPLRSSATHSRPPCSCPDAPMEERWTEQVGRNLATLRSWPARPKTHPPPSFRHPLTPDTPHAPREACHARRRT